MILYVICIDQERGKYLAFAWNGSQLLKSVSHESADAAVGSFVREHSGPTKIPVELRIVRVVDVEAAK